jgi:hypothetical protein
VKSPCTLAPVERGHYFRPHSGGHATETSSKTIVNGTSAPILPSTEVVAEEFPREIRNQRRNFKEMLWKQLFKQLSAVTGTRSLPTAVSLSFPTPLSPSSSSPLAHRAPAASGPTAAGAFLFS